MDFTELKSLTIPEGKVSKIIDGYGNILWKSISYKYITPMDPTAFPVGTGWKLLTINGTESWTYSSSAVYTNTYSSYIKNQPRASVVGYSKDYEFLPSIQTVGSMTNNSFIFNGTSSTPVNGNLSFKSANTTSKNNWVSWLTSNPFKILISVKNPGSSTWKPAVDSNGVTGYWDGGSGFCPIDIPYLGEELVTNNVINNYYQAYFASSGGNRYWRPSTDSSRTVRIDVEPGKYYYAKWDSTISDTVGTIFRAAFTNDGTPKSSTGNKVYNAFIGTPQDNVTAVLYSDTYRYMVIQVSGALFPGNIGHLSVRELTGYTPATI